jgi:hypothetical protein
MTFSVFLLLFDWTLQQLRPSDDGFSPNRSGFDPWEIHAGLFAALMAEEHVSNRITSASPDRSYSLHTATDVIFSALFAALSTLTR